jgi:ribonuclease BN (tRNA processing enzyme)
LEEVDAVVLTHEHHDHWTDVYGFHIASTYVLERVGIPVYAPADLAAFLETRRPTLDPRPVADGDHVQVGALRLTFSRTDHPVETLAVRVDGGGKALGYSADSGPGWSIRTLGSDIDLALCEASFLLDREGSVQHLSARQAGTMARAAEVGQLVLTHVMPTVDVDAVRTEGVEAFGGPVEIAAIDAVYEV